MNTPPMTIALFSTSMLSLLLGSWAFLDSPRKRVNQLFCLLCISVTGWTSIVGAAEITFARGINRGAISIGLGYLFGSLIPFLFFMVCRTFDRTGNRSRTVPLIALSLCVICVYLGFNGYIVREVSISASSSYYKFRLGSGFFLFLFYVILVSALSAREIAKCYLSSPNFFVRLQLLYFSIGAAISFIIAILCNLILPALGVTYLSPMGAFSPIIALSTISFSITKHRLLDLNISLKQTAAIGVWTILLIVPMLVYLVAPITLSKMALTNKLFIIATIGFWASVLFWMVRKGEISFVKLGGERGHAYKNALDTLARSLVGILSSADVMRMCVEYLQNNHGIQGATLWHQNISGQYSIVGEPCDSLPADEVFSYFDRLHVSRYLGETLIFGTDSARGIPLPPDALQLCGVIVLPSISPGTYFITMQRNLGAVILDPIDIGLIASFSSYTAAALKSAIQMEQIGDLNRFLSEARASLASYNCALETQVEQRTSGLRSQLKDHIAFSEILVHDLSNELNTIAHDLMSRTFDPLDLRLRLLRLISIIRDTGSFLATEEMRLDFAMCNLTEIVREVLGENAHLIRAKEILVVSQELPQVYSQRFSLKQILRNIIGNAVKYIGDGVSPRIEITSSRETSWIALRVSDNGIGIPSREVSKIFMPLFRGSNHFSRESTVSGSGMGLFIAQRLAGNVGIDIHVVSEEGAGTEVVVRLPDIARQHDAQAS